jgi:hypothetical protein
MIYLILIYILFLAVWVLFSYLVVSQLKKYGFVGDFTKVVTRLYWIISGALIIVSFFVIFLV